jgi:tRNA(adenine34) deaminase
MHAKITKLSLKNMINLYSDEYFMKQAIKEAEYAYEKGEVPVGAVIVCENRIIGRGHNLTETLNDVTAHAEMQAITAAANFLGAKYLNECTLYITLEPCGMCAGAIFWAQLNRVVFGASDPKRGYLKQHIMLHPKTSVQSGIEEDTCKSLLQSFFQSKRKNTQG